MTRFSSRRKIAALLLGLSLAAPLASASPPRTPSRPGPRIEALSLGGLLEEIWQFLSSGVRSKCGGSLDPSGGCASQPPGTGSWNKCGASADPDGKCTSQPPGSGSSSTPDAGASADPSG